MLLDAAGNSVTCVDELNFRRKFCLKSGAKERIMTAAKDEDIGPSGEHVTGVFFDGGIDFGASQLTRFDKVDKFWTGLRDDTEVTGMGVDKAVELITAKGCLSRKDTDGA